MYTQNETTSIKQVGMNGQISLGKEYAGKQIQLSKLDNGTIIIKPGQFIPDQEHLFSLEKNKQINYIHLDFHRNTED